MDVGYVVDSVYEVWHFAETSDDLIRCYIDTFLKHEATHHNPSQGLQVEAIISTISLDPHVARSVKVK